MDLLKIPRKFLSVLNLTCFKTLTWDFTPWTAPVNIEASSTTKHTYLCPPATGGTFIKKKNTKIQETWSSGQIWKPENRPKASNSATFYHRCRKGWPTSKSSGMPAVVTWQLRAKSEGVTTHQTIQKKYSRIQSAPAKKWNIPIFHDPEKKIYLNSLKLT